VNRGNVLKALGRHAEAILSYTQGIELKPVYSEAFQSFVFCCCNANCKISPVAEYLARHRTADLFLGSFPVNAGRTAGDALWAGLPELIRPTTTQHQDLAVHPATHPQRLAQIRQRLAHNSCTTPRFDTGSFTRNLETAYEMIRRRPPARAHARCPNSNRSTVATVMLAANSDCTSFSKMWNLFMMCMLR